MKNIVISEESFPNGYKLMWPNTNFYTTPRARVSALAEIARRTGGKIVGSVVKVLN